MDKLLYSLGVAVVGMLVVFFGLVILIGLIKLMTILSQGKQKPKQETAPAPVEGAQPAASGIAAAQRAVNKYLQLGLCSLPNSPNLLQTELPGQHHPFEAQFFQAAHPGRILHRHLRTGMKLRFREQGPHQFGYARILYNDRRDPEREGFTQIGRQQRPFLFLHQCI